MRETMEQKEKMMIRNAVLGIFGALGLIWVNSFVSMNSGDTGFGYVGLKFVRIFFVVGLFSAALYYSSEAIELKMHIMISSKRLYDLFSALFGFILIMWILLEMRTDSFSILNGKEVLFFDMNLHKKYLYDIWAIVIFPVSIRMIFKSMKESDFGISLIFWGCIGILRVSVIGCLIFQPLGKIWLLDLMILNTITLSAAVWKYVFPEAREYKWNMIAVIIFYVLFRVLLMRIQCGSLNGGLGEFLYGDNWQNYRQGVREMLKNAAIFGTSDYFRNSAFLHEWLYTNNRHILQILFYGGWAAAIVFVLFLIGFAVILLKLLDHKTGRDRANYLVYVSAAGVLLVRTVFGILNNFGLGYPIALPFCGFSGSPMDAMAFALLLVGAWEELKICKFRQCLEDFVPAREVLGDQEFYRIIDKYGEEYEVKTGLEDLEVGDDGEVLPDIAQVVLENCKINCRVDGFCLDGREFGVFEEDYETKFILEHSDEGWISLNESEKEMEERVRSEYFYFRGPFYMEKPDRVRKYEDYGEYEEDEEDEEFKDD